MKVFPFTFLLTVTRILEQIEIDKQEELIKAKTVNHNDKSDTAPSNSAIPQASSDLSKNVLIGMASSSGSNNVKGQKTALSLNPIAKLEHIGYKQESEDSYAPHVIASELRQQKQSTGTSLLNSSSKRGVDRLWSTLFRRVPSGQPRLSQSQLHSHAVAETTRHSQSQNTRQNWHYYSLASPLTPLEVELQKQHLDFQPSSFKTESATEHFHIGQEMTFFADTG